MAIPIRPKNLVVNGYTYILKPVSKSVRLKTGKVVNFSMFDMVLDKEAQQWIKQQLARHRRIFRDEVEKLEYALFSTDIADPEKLKITILRQFPLFKDRQLKLREILTPEELETITVPPPVHPNSKNIEVKVRPQPKSPEGLSGEEMSGEIGPEDVKVKANRK